MVPSQRQPGGRGGWPASSRGRRVELARGLDGERYGRRAPATSEAAADATGRRAKLTEGARNFSSDCPHRARLWAWSMRGANVSQALWVQSLEKIAPRPRPLCKRPKTLARRQPCDGRGSGATQAPDARRQPCQYRRVSVHPQTPTAPAQARAASSGGQCRAAPRARLSARRTPPPVNTTSPADAGREGLDDADARRRAYNLAATSSGDAGKSDAPPAEVCSRARGSAGPPVCQHDRRPRIPHRPARVELAAL